MSEGKYDGLGASLEDWLEGIRLALINTAQCLTPEGKVAIMTDDFVRKDCHQPLGLHVWNVLLQEGFEQVMTIYNFNRNFLAMSPVEMSRVKNEQLLVNRTKIIQRVARRPVSCMVACDRGGDDEP